MEELFDIKFIGLPHMILQKVCVPVRYSFFFFFFFFCISVSEQEIHWAARTHPQDKFKEATDELRARFLDSSNAGFLMNTDYHGKKAVPMEGFAHYAEQVWSTIRSNKDIDMPTQVRFLLIEIQCFSSF